MLRPLSLIGLLAFFGTVLVLRSEVEITIDRNGSVTRRRIDFPVLISLRDNEGRPVKGAIVALEELGLNLSSDEEIVRKAKSRTDENGMIVIMHSAMAPETSLKSFTIKIQSVVTIVSEGHRTVTIKLGEHFKDGQYSHSESTVPHLKLILTEQATGHAKAGKDDQQPGSSDGEKPSN
jgi:hypothetical protein